MIVDPRAEEGAAKEAKLFNIPVIALMNSDCDKSLVTHPIPANDASLQSITFILDAIAQTYIDNLAPLTAPTLATEHEAKA